MSKDGRGTESELASLHGLLAQYFASQLKSGEKLAPSELNAIRQFLKDNAIDCVGHENVVLNDITKDLPYFELEDEMVGEPTARILHPFWKQTCVCCFP